MLIYTFCFISNRINYLSPGRERNFQVELVPWWLVDVVVPVAVAIPVKISFRTLLNFVLPIQP